MPQPRIVSVLRQAPPVLTRELDGKEGELRFGVSEVGPVEGLEGESGVTRGPRAATRELRHFHKVAHLTLSVPASPPVHALSSRDNCTS